MATRTDDAPAEKANAAQRIHWVMQQVDYVQKIAPDMSKPSGERLAYSIVSHDSVTELVRPLIVRAGLIYYPVNLSVKQDGNRTEAQFEVCFENILDRTDTVLVATMGYGIDKQDKGPGKAISYGVKYALLKAFGLATGDDPDLNQGEDSNHRTTLDSRLEELSLAVSTSPDRLALQTLMDSPTTKEIMAAAQARNPGEFSKMRFDMSEKMKALKAKEKPGDPPATDPPAETNAVAETGAATSDGAGLGGSA